MHRSRLYGLFVDTPAPDAPAAAAFWSAALGVPAVPERHEEQFTMLRGAFPALTIGVQAIGAQAIGAQATGAQTGGAQAGGAQADETHADGTQATGLQTGGVQTGGSPGDGEAPRYHVDIETDDHEAEAARLTGLGAVEINRWLDCHVMRAPGGHLLCVVPVHSDAELFAAQATVWP